MLSSLFALLCIPLALLAVPAQAQQYAGDFINNTLPVVPGSEIVYFRINDPKGKNNNLTLTNYYSLQLNGQRLVPSQIQRAVIIIHGLDRDPGTYMSNMLSAINNGGISDPNINQGNVAILTPYFPNGDDKNIGYPWTAGLAAGKGSTTNALVWQASYWASGANNQYPSSSTSVSSFEVLDQLVKYFDNRAMFPNMKHIVVGGHSLGAQTTNRYAEVGAQFATNSPVTYYIANPNSYGWLSTSRPLPIGSCTTFDNWREGLNNYSSYPMTYNLAFVNTGRTAVLDQYNARSKAYARGLQDTGDDSTTCAPYTTGINRNERFFNFINAFPAICNAPGTGQCDTIDYVNTGHDGGAMFASSAGLARLFTDNFYGDGKMAYDFGYPRIQAGDDPYPNPAMNSSTTSSGPSTVYAGNMTFAGCWTDSVNSRSLKITAYDKGSNSVETCTAYCAGQGYTVAGVEFSSQCYCGNALTSSAQQVIPQSCTLACSGNSSEICGDNNRMSLYSNGTPKQLPIPGTPEVIGNYNSYQCMTEATSGRALSATSYTDAVNMTLESCAAFCNGYKYFGTEFGQECYCGSYFNAGSTIASNSDCSKTCSGSDIELCGAASRLNTYQLSSGASVSVISQGPPGSTTAAPAGSTAAVIPSASACPSTDGQTLTDVNGANYTIHCSSDSSTGSYLNGQATNSYLDCMAACDSASGTGCIGWTYSGAANGLGSGTCYLKSGTMGNYIASGANLISGTLFGAVVASPTQATQSQSSASSSAGYCPSSDGQVVIDGNGANYTLHCSSDSSTNSYNSGSASKSVVDCMNACDAASTSGCIGFTYVGAQTGIGGGTCYFKQGSIGSIIPAGSGLITGVLLSSGSASIAQSSSSAAASTSASVTASSAASGLCPAADGTTMTDGNGLPYTVHCSSDSAFGSYSNAQASNSYLDCMAACDSNASGGCTGAVYVGATNGAGSGTCWLKMSMGAFTPANANYIAIARAPVVASTSMSASGTMSSSTVVASSGTSSTIASSAFTSASTSTSSIISTSTQASLSSGPPLVGHLVSVTCPTNNGSIYTASNGLNFLIECGIDHAGGDMSSTSVQSFSGCIEACASAKGCLDVSLSGSACYLKQAVGAAISNGGIMGAKFVANSPSPATTTTTPLATSSSSSSTVILTSPSSSSSSQQYTSSSSTAAMDSSSSSTSTSQQYTSSSSTAMVTSSSSSSTSTEPYTSSSPTSSSSSSSSTVASTSSMMSSSMSSTMSATLSSSTTPSSSSTSSSTMATTSSASTTIATSTSSTTTTGNLPAGFTSVGCYTDNTGGRTLNVQLASSSSMTPSQCAMNCRAQGYKYSGTEYADECYCDNTIRSNGAPASSGCNMACSGDKKQICGGSNRLSLVQDTTWVQTFFARTSFNTWNLMSCYVDSGSTRTLGAGIGMPGGSSNTTIANCLTACQASGYTYCGAEYAQECYGSVNAPSASLALSGDPLLQGCSMACKANSTESCGGSSRILIYINNGTTH